MNTAKKYFLESWESNAFYCDYRNLFILFCFFSSPEWQMFKECRSALSEVFKHCRSCVGLKAQHWSSEKGVWASSPTKLGPGSGFWSNGTRSYWTSVVEEILTTEEAVHCLIILGCPFKLVHRHKFESKWVQLLWMCRSNSQWLCDCNFFGICLTNMTTNSDLAC